MSTICPTDIGLGRDEQFQKFKRVYKDRKLSDRDLVLRLQAFRESEDLDIDWYPETEEDYKRFTNYLDMPGASIPKYTVTKEYIDKLYRTITTLYTPRMLNNRIDRIASIFNEYVTNLVNKSSFGVSRQQVISAQARNGKNGFDSILEKTFDYINKLSTIDGQIAWYKHSNPSATESQLAADRSWLEYRAKEFAKIDENKEALATLAALKIASKEGFIVNIDNMEYDFSKTQDMDELTDSNESENGTDTEEAQKGDRYVDYRTLSLSATLSTEARRLLDKIYLTDRKGNIVRDDLGYPVNVDTKQAIVSLHKILQATTPETMDADLRKASTRYPWVRSLVDHLVSHPDDNALVYCNFKKARSIYYYGYKDSKKNNRITVRQTNNVADGKGLSKEAGVNLTTGALSDGKYSIISQDGKLVDKDAVSKIKGAVDGVSKLPLKAKQQSQAPQYSSWTVKDTAKDWNEQVDATPVESFDELTSVLRGLGFSVTPEDIKRALANSAPVAKISGTKHEKYGDVTSYDSSLDKLVQSLNSILERAGFILDSGDDLTGSHLYNYAQDEFSKISDLLSSIQRGEVEERSISGSKSLSAATTPNALHDLVDFLSNVAGLSDEEYRSAVMERLGRFEGMSLGFGKNMRLVGWLDDLVNDGREGSDASYKTRRKNFKVVDFTDLTNITRKDFASLSSAEHAVLSYVMYMRGTENRTSDLDGHMYEVPIQADYDTAYNFIVAPRYTRDELIERLALEVECEAQRIAAINERKASDDKNNPKRALVDSTYEKNGTDFLIFPALNTNGFIERYKNADPKEAHNEVVSAVIDEVNKLLDSEHGKLTKLGFFNKESLKLAGLKNENDASVDDWLLNSMYARLQITKLMYGGLAAFKSNTDFEKRNMYSHATRLPLYTKATYRGEVVGKDNQNVLYFADEEAKSSAYNHICKIADKLHSQHKITKRQADYMKEQYMSITTTDGQGLRTLPSLRAIKVMSSIWTDADEVAYQHIMSGKYTPRDVQHFIVGIKPVYTGEEIIEAQPGQYQKPVRLPVLHKYSEMVLLPEMLEDVDAQTGTTPLRAMNKINKRLGKGNEIDLFIFGSGVKVGAHSVLDPFAKSKEDGSRIFKTSDDIADYVVDNIHNNSFWVHNLPLKYYGITSSMHADVVDENIAWATQAEKEAFGNIQKGEEVEVAGRRMQAEDARALYYKIKAARTVDTFKRISKRFADPAQIAKILKEELASKPYKSRDLLFALQVRDSGRFAYPLFSPNLQHDVVALLSSVIRKQFTKVPTRGANMTQTTSLGFDNELSDDGTTLQAFASESNIPGFNTLGLHFDDKGKFQYSDAIVPITDSGFEQFADENGNITPERLNQLVKDGFIPESALYFIAYRTPSDAEHSIIPCRIKGFVSNAAGPSIRLPREIMKMTGHDYDGDKMRCHFKKTYVGWNYDAIKRDFEKFQTNELLQSVLSESDDPTLTPYEVFKRGITAGQNPESGKYRAVREVKYDWDKDPLENIGADGQYDALNNALIDIMFGQLTSENGSLKMFIPGGCAETVEYANTIGTRHSKQEVISPFASTHATESHDYMMEGADMIGIYALYNSAGAMFQRLNLGYISQTNSKGQPINVTIFNKSIDKLFPVLSGNGENSQFNSLGMSRLLNASVDNGKDPLLGYLNQTAGLSHLTNFLSAAGLEEGEIHLLFNQPVIKELAARVKSADSSTIPLAISNMLNEMFQGRDVNKKNDYTQEQAVGRVAGMTKGMLKESLGYSYTSILTANKSVWETQVSILQLMQHLNPAARDLEQFTKLTRPESDAGGIDSSIGGIISKLIQLDKFRERLSPVSTDPVRISGVGNVVRLRDIYESSMTPQMILDAVGDELPEVVALNSLMKDSILKFLRPYFPQVSESWMRVTRRIADQYSYDRLPASVAERITNDMILYKLLQDPSFITGSPQEEQKRIIVDVPKDLRALKRRIAEAVKNPGSDKVAERLNDNIFLNNLDLGASLNTENQNINRIRFKLNGATLEDTADTIRAAWGELLYTGDNDIKQLAIDLFKYNLYTNGFTFGRYEFSHFAPVGIILNTPGYIKALNNVLESSWTQEDEDMFAAQYVMNHWGDKNLLERFTPAKLPMNLRTELGYNATVENPVKPEAFAKLVERSDFIIVRRTTNNRTTDDLYLLQKNSDGTVLGLISVSKLGLRNRSQQVMVQYNPRVRDLSELKPVFASNLVVWEGRGANDDTVIAGDDEVTDADRMAAIDDIPYEFPPMVTAETVKAADKECGKAKDGKLTAEQAAAMGFSDPDADDMYYLVNVDEDGNIEPGYYAATPRVIEQARMQQAFHDLNIEMRKFMKSAGVREGVLEDAEARATAGGVTLFNTARVVGEEVKALILLSDNKEAADYALPEECAHLALEMLGGHTVVRDEDGNIVRFEHENKNVERLLNYLNNNQRELEDAFGGQYDQYLREYNNNREKVIKEAAGKLVAKQWFLQQYAKTKPTKNLVQRVIDAIKAFFKNPVWSIRKINDAIFGAEKIASQLARDLLSGRLADEMSLEKITANGEFKSLNKDISGKQDILSKMMKYTVKRYDILSRRLKYSLGKGATSASLDATKRQLDKLKSQIDNQKLETTVVDYLNDTMSFMTEMEKSLDDAINNRPVNSVCKKLGVVKDTMFSFASVVRDIRDAIASGELEDDVNLKQTLKEVSDRVEDFWTKYNRISLEYFEKFLSGVYGEDGVTVTIGKDKGKHISIHDMARFADRDISMASRFLHAVSDCNDYVLQAVDDITREAKLAARERVRNARPKFEAAIAELIKEQGNRDQSWMYEWQTVDGKRVRTGRYISEKAAENLSPAKKNYYKVYMELYNDGKSCCPSPLVTERGIIMFRKQHYEKMREAQGIKGKAGEEWENAKRGILEMGDVDFENELVIKDFEGNIVDQLPLKFLNKGKNESYDDMTEDAGTALMAFLGMAYEYQEMNNVLGIIENARYASSMRDIKQRRGLRNLITKAGDEEDVHYSEPFTVKQAKSNIQKAMDDYISMHVYGHLQKDEGTIGKTRISKRKAVTALTGYTSLAQMAVNIHQRIANINTGATQIVVETAGKEIKFKDVLWASKIWMANSADRLADTGKTDYDNKLSLWMDKFDIHQDNGRETSSTLYGKSNASRAFNTHLLYAGLSIGEDYLAGTTALAFARNYKMLDAEGKPSNLWDAYKVKYTNPKDKTGAYLELKKGYKKADGSTMTFEDEKKFMKKVIATNFELQGIYNVDDRSAIQQHSLGALAIMYRKWIAPALKRRYAGVQYSKLRDEYTEGYYRTALRYVSDSAKDWFAPMSEEECNTTIWRILTDFRAMRNAMVLNWNKMTDYEKGNCRKSMREMAIMIGLIVASGLLKNLPPDDHDGNKFLSWADDMAMTQILRLRSEIGSQAPTPNLINESFRILSSPFAAMRPLRDTLHIFDLMWLPNYTEEVKSGRYKGHTKAYKYFRELPIISMFKKIDNFVDPTPIIQYYKDESFQ